jgi:hypothetical protein
VSNPAPASCRQHAMNRPVCGWIPSLCAVLAVISVVPAMIILAGVLYSPDRAVANLIVAGLAATAGAFRLLRGHARLDRRHLILVGILAVVPLFVSLLPHDGYSGGDFLFHIHLGFPHSWSDGRLSLPGTAATARRACGLGTAAGRSCTVTRSIYGRDICVA